MKFQGESLGSHPSCLKLLSNLVRSIAGAIRRYDTPREPRIAKSPRRCGRGHLGGILMGPASADSYATDWRRSAALLITRDPHKAPPPTWGVLACTGRDLLLVPGPVPVPVGRAAFSCCHARTCTIVPAHLRVGRAAREAEAGAHAALPRCGRGGAPVARSRRPLPPTDQPAPCRLTGGAQELGPRWPLEHAAELVRAAGQLSVS